MSSPKPLRIHQKLRVSNRCLVIGDVHGCLSELKSLIKQSGINTNDDILIVGDLVAKGPSSSDVLQFCINRNIRSVLGNHDHLVLRYADRLNRLTKLNQLCFNGNEFDLTTTARLQMAELTKLKENSEHDQIAMELTDEQLTYIASLPLTITLKNHSGMVLVHAGVVPNTPLENQNPFDLLYLRNILSDGKATKNPNEPDSKPWIDCYKQLPYVIFGHDAKRKLQQSEYALGLDTGCCYGNHLTGVILPEKKLISAKAERVYRKPESD